MSAFLGPIHFWLYRKIQLANEFADHVLDNSDLQDKDEIHNKADELFGTPGTGDLETIIDTSNIHGWLQMQVCCVEDRLAYFVTNILKKNNDLEMINRIARQFGQQNKLEYTDSAAQVYKELEDRLLSGMPCDRVNHVTEQSDDLVEYDVSIDIHKDHWTKNDGDVENYYIIIENLIKGMLEDCPLEFNRTGNRQYSIARREK